MEQTDVLIIGGGFAGASTAFHLSQASRASILLLDREVVPGAHASGRNASLVLQSVEDAAIRSVVAESRRYYEEHASQLGFRSCGSLLLGTREQLESTRDPAIPSTLLSPEEARRRVPALDGHDFDAALETPGDGVMDIWALLQHYLAGARARGAKLQCDRDVLGISGSAPYRVETSRGPIEAACLVNAAGAWAPDVGSMVGASSLGLVPWKRHLFLLDGLDGGAPDWPFVWDLDREFYFRPDSGRLLFSICDEERSAALDGTVTPGISQTMAELVWKELPALRRAHEHQVWSCYRTKAADGRFVIGWDPGLAGFLWVAGLGGHGVGSSWEVGRQAALAFCSGATATPGAFSPARLVTGDR